MQTLYEGPEMKYIGLNSLRIYNNLHPLEFRWVENGNTAVNYS